MLFSKIMGTGSCIGSKLVTNDDIAKKVDTSDEWITSRSGIRERRILAENESLTDLAEVAAKNALEMAQLEPNDIDLIILATTTPDLAFPSTAVLLQERLGIKNDCPAFDVSAACAGFNYALTLGDSLIRTKQAKRALIIGAEALTRLIDWTDCSTCFLFGDGVGAAILGESDEPGIICSKMHAAGQHKDLLYSPNGISTDEPAKVQMQGNAVFRFGVNTLKNAVIELLEEAQMSKSDIDWLVPHQANLRIITAVAKRLELPMERVIVNLDKYGNTSSASVPIALDEGIRLGKIKRGEVLLLESFGAGFAWGSALVKY